MLRHALVGSVVLLAFAAPALGQEVELKWKFKEGDKFWVEDSNVQKQVVVVVGQTQKVEQKTTTITSYEITKVTSETIEVRMKIEAVDVRSDGGIGVYEKIMEKSKGTVFNITMTPRGEVKKLDGFEDFAKRIGGGDPDVDKMLKELFTPEMFIQSIEQGFAFVPDKKVKKGESWTRGSKIPFGGIGEFRSSSTFTYNGKGDGGEQIAFKQNLTYMPPKKGADFGGLFKIVKGDLKADNARGTYVFDAEKGRLVSGTSEMTIKGTLTLDLNGQMEISVDLRVEQTATSRVHDKNPLKDS